MDSRRTHKAAVVHAAQPGSNPWLEAASRPAGYGDVRIRITSLNGSQSDGIVFATVGFVIRVALAGCDDAVEFFCHGRQWHSEDGDKVTIEFFAIEDSEPDYLSAIANRGGPSSFCGTPIPTWGN
jgi:hypothetical protein